jgi:DNA-binding transcriptional MerR regulator
LPVILNEFWEWGLMAKNTKAKQKEIPSKLYYSISEVASLTGVKAHVLRYWDSEFPTLKPRKTRTGARRYRQPDIDEIQTNKHLLYEEGYKIAGAVKMRRQSKRGVPAPVAPDQITLDFSGMSEGERISFVRGELKDILKLVKGLNAQNTKGAKKAPLKKKQAKA